MSESTIIILAANSAVIALILGAIAFCSYVFHHIIKEDGKEYRHLNWLAVATGFMGIALLMVLSIFVH